MSETILVGEGDYGILVHPNDCVDLLVNDGSKPIPELLRGLIGAFLLIRSDESFLAECLDAHDLAMSKPANEVAA